MALAIPARTSAPSPHGLYAERERRHPTGAEIVQRARWLRTWRANLVIPIAEAANEIMRTEAWVPYGYGQIRDFAREHLERRSQWVRDMASLHDAVKVLPEIGAALLGQEGCAPLSRTAAVLIGKTATAETVREWIDLAQQTTIAGLKASLKEARAVGSTRPLPRAVIGSPQEEPQGTAFEATFSATISSESRLDARADEFESTVQFRLQVPGPVRLGFNEGLQVFRAISGGPAPIAAYWEALLAEAYSRGDPADDLLFDPQSAGERCGRGACADATENIATSIATRAERAVGSIDLAGTGGPIETRSTKLDGGSRTLEGSPGDEDSSWPRRLVEHLQELLTAQDAIERELGRILAWLDARCDWSLLGFVNAFDFAEQELGWSRTAAGERMRLARDLQAHPLLRRAYNDGKLGVEKARIVCRILGHGSVPASLERSWVQRAIEATVKRMRQEESLVLRKRVGDPEALAAVDREEPAEPSTVGTASDRPVSKKTPRLFPPTSDAEWFASLHRQPGAARERIARLGAQAIAWEKSDVWIVAELPADLQNALSRALESRRRELEKGAMDWLRAPSMPTDDVAVPASVAAARQFALTGMRVQAWVAVQALLEDFVETHDDPSTMPKRPFDTTYQAAGWTCMGPGCTRQDGLENHHLQHRAQGGGDEPENQICLCAFCHRQGEHGRYGTCKGRAPLDIVYRRGRSDLAVWFRNERRIRPPMD